MDMDLLGHLVRYYILVTIVIAFIYRRKYFSTNMKYFFYVLLTLGLVDWVGKYGVSSRSATLIVYNTGVIIHILGFIFLYYSIVNDEKIKRTYSYIAAFFFIFCLVNFIFFNPIIENFLVLNYFVGALSLVATVSLFFKKIINTDKIMHLPKFLWFWVSIGLLLLYVGIIPIMSAIPLKLTSRSTLNLLLYILNFVMYTSFNIGLIWSTKEHNQLSL